MGDYSTIEIRGDNEELKSSLSQAESMFKTFGNKVMQLFQQATGVYSFDDAINKIKKGIADFEESQEHVRGLERVMRNMGSAAGFTTAQFASMNEELQKVGKYGANAITDAQAHMSKFSNVRLDIFQDALKSAMNLAEFMGGSLSSAVDVLGAALNKPRKALEALDDAGVDFSDKSRATIEAMLRMGNVVGAQKEILRALEEEMSGEAAKAADTFGVRMQKLADSTDEVWQTIGGYLVPYINKAIDIMNAAKTIVLQLAKDWIDSWELIGEGAKSGVEVLTEWFWKAVEVGTEAFSLIQAATWDWRSAAEGMFLSVKSAMYTMFADILEAAFKWGDKMLAQWPAIEKGAQDMWKKIVEWTEWGIGEAKTYWDEFVKYTKLVFAGIMVNIEAFIANMKMRLSGQNPGEWLWKDFIPSFKHASEEQPGGLSLIEKMRDQGLKAFTGGGDAIDDFRKKAKETGADADATLEPFWNKFDDHLAENKYRVDQFTDKIKDILGKSDYKNIKGTFDKKRIFKGLEGREVERDAGDRTGQFEDLVSMNKRIQEASSKPRSLEELEKQTKIMEKEQAIQEAIANEIKEFRKAAHTKDKKDNIPPPPNLATTGMGY